MKKILCIMCAMLVFASCSKESLPTTSGQNPDGSYTFNIGIEEPDYAPRTRAKVTMGRYMLEMYEGNLTATPVKITNTTGTFNVELKRGVDYVCLFWADNGAAAYDATSLKAVKQTTETALGTAAYCARVTVNSNNFNGAVTLRHAVAELSFIDKNGLTQATNALKITYPYASATLNVGDGTVTHVAGETVRTIGNITPPAGTTTAFAVDFILAPTAAVGKLTGLKFQLNSEQVKTLAETAIQANYRTKITGEFQPKPPTVGDFYYKNGNWSSTYVADVDNPCIGIVFVMNADGKTGKIVSLDERVLKWSTENITTGATSKTDGATNTATIFALGTYATAYPAFAWCAAKNTPATAGINWYIPANDELFALYDVWNGSSSSTNDDVARAAFNKKLTTSEGNALGIETYWSSTEYESDNTRSWYVGFWKRSSGGIEKGRKPFYVRCVSVVSFKQ